MYRFEWNFDPFSFQNSGKIDPEPLILHTQIKNFHLTVSQIDARSAEKPTRRAIKICARHNDGIQLSKTGLGFFLHQVTKEEIWYCFFSFRPSPIPRVHPSIYPCIIYPSIHVSSMYHQLSMYHPSLHVSSIHPPMYHLSIHGVIVINK